MRSDEHQFPEVREGFEGCVSCYCGAVIAMYGEIEEDPSLLRQAESGEEDQSVPGWDGGA